MQQLLGGAWIKTISLGVIMTPLARDELTGPRGDGGFITGSDFIVLRRNQFRLEVNAEGFE